MPYLILAYDYPGRERQREQARAAHRAYLASFGPRLLASGALLNDDGTIIGGASLLDTDDREEASCFEAEDPYSKAGIRAEVRIIRWRLRWWLGTFDSGGHRPSRSERV